MKNFLVIGYGNPMRRDDGLGWFVTNQLTALSDEHPLRCITSFQLMPEMADAISQADHVFFVDAAIGDIAGFWQSQPVIPENAAPDTSAFTHHIGPEQLLKMANILYNNCPTAELITVIGEDFEFGEGFSDSMEKSAWKVINYIEQIIKIQNNI